MPYELAADVLSVVLLSSSVGFKYKDEAYPSVEDREIDERLSI